MPSRKKSRVREALSPGPAPTISAISCRGSAIERCPILGRPEAEKHTSQRMPPTLTRNKCRLQTRPIYSGSLCRILSGLPRGSRRRLSEPEWGAPVLQNRVIVRLVVSFQEVVPSRRGGEADVARRQFPHQGREQPCIRM